MCISFFVDNASVKMGRINSMKNRVLVKNPMCTLLSVLVIWHIMQHVKEEIALLELLDLMLRI
jgi:hypothetical protein